MRLFKKSVCMVLSMAMIMPSSAVNIYAANKEQNVAESGLLYEGYSDDVVEIPMLDEVENFVNSYDDVEIDFPENTGFYSTDEIDPDYIGSYYDEIDTVEMVANSDNQDVEDSRMKELKEQLDSELAEAIDEYYEYSESDSEEIIADDTDGKESLNKDSSEYMEGDELSENDIDDEICMNDEGVEESTKDFGLDYNPAKCKTQGSYKNVTWSIDNQGVLRVNGTGDYTDPSTRYLLFNRSPWYEYREDITKAYVSLKGCQNLAFMFYGCNNLESVEFSNMDTSNAVTMRYMFWGCSSLKSVDLSGFDTTKLLDTCCMFQMCTGIKSIKFGPAFKLQNVTQMQGMFWGCEELTSLSLNSFDTRNAILMSNMFDGCRSLENIDVSKLNTSSVVCFNYMFQGCNMRSLDLSGFDMSKAEEIDGMFRDCEYLESINLPAVRNGKVRDLSYLFAYCSSLKSINIDINTTNVVNMRSMYEGCSSLTSINLSGMDVKNVTDMSNLFSYCTSLRSINLSGMDVKNVTSMSNMFRNCTSLKNLVFNNFNTCKVRNMSGMFMDCSNLETITFGGFNTSNVTDMSDMFNGCSAVKNISIKFNTNYVKDMQRMFANCTSLQTINLQSFRTPRLKAMGEMFAYCNNLVSVNLSGCDLSNLCAETEYEESGYDYKVYENDNLFNGCSKLKNIYTPLKLYVDFYLPRDNSEIWLMNNSAVITQLPLHHSSSTLITKVIGGSAIARLDSGKNKGQAEIVVNVDDLMKSSKTYSESIAKAAIRFATLAYSSGDANGDCYRALGFNDMEYVDDDTTLHGFDYDPDIVDVSKMGLTNLLWIAHRKYDVDGTPITVMLVNLRGTLLTEWIDNFDSGLGDTHAGFKRAADYAAESVEKYIAKHNIKVDNNLKILVTGHSRGAAAANLLGKMIDDKEVAVLKNISSDNVFVYTYATPNVTKDNNVKNSRYNNIYNIVNPEDFVTKVLPAKWGYKRYGKTYVFPDRSTNFDKSVGYTDIEGVNRYSYVDYLALVQYYREKYETISKYEPYISGMGDVTDYVNEICKSVPTVEDYYKKCLKNKSKKHGMIKSTRTGDWFEEDSLMSLFSWFLGYKQSDNSKLEKWSYFTLGAAVNGDYGKVGKTTAKFFVGHAASLADCLWYMREDFNRAHEAETYLAMMDVTSKACLQKEKWYKQAVVSCPVDVTVKDENGEVVAEIVNNKITNADEELNVAVEGESKSFYLPGDGEYTIDITGNGTGTMDYTVIEYDPDTGEVSRAVYQDVPVNKNETYEQIIDTDTAISDLELIDENSNVIEMDAVLSGDEIGDLSIEVIVEGIGQADSVYNLSLGDYVLLKASTNGINKFLGWYDGSDSLVSEYAEYGISVKNNMSLTAKFTENTEGMWAETVGTYYYNGGNIVPQINVYDGETLLTDKVDYTLTYKNNKNVYMLTPEDEGFDKSKAPVVIVKGKGNYSSSRSDNVYFTIQQADMSDSSISITIPDKTYTGKSEQSVPIVKQNGKKLKESIDYTVEYSDDTVNPGDVTVTIVGIGNFTGSITDEYRIYKKEYDFKNLVIHKVSDQEYNGYPIEPLIEVRQSKNNEVSLIPGEDYTVTYVNNVNVGTAQAIIRGCNEYGAYGNSRTVTFKIVPKTIVYENEDEGNVKIICDNPTYSGTALTPDVKLVDKDTEKEIPAEYYTVSYSNNTNVPEIGAADKKMPTIKITGKKNYKGTISSIFNIMPLELTTDDYKANEEIGLTVSIPDMKDSAKEITEKDIKPLIKLGKKTLTKGRDYDVFFTRNADGGKLSQSAMISFKGNYAGTINDVPFIIYNTTINASELKIDFKDNIDVFEYTGQKITPPVIVTAQIDGVDRELVEGRDYKVAYANNVNVGSSESKSAPSVKITGTGAYKGNSDAIKFTIKPMELKEELISVIVEDTKYTGQEVKPKVTIIDKSTGKPFKSVNYNISYENNINKYLGNENPEVANEDKPVVIITGKGNYTSDIEEDGVTTSKPLKYNFRIFTTPISSMVFEKIDYVEYNGKKYEPKDIIIYKDKNKNEGNKLREGVDYILSYDGYDNTKVGTGKVKVEGIGEYGGTKILTFTIVPKWLKWFLL